MMKRVAESVAVQTLLWVAKPAQKLQIRNFKTVVDATVKNYANSDIVYEGDVYDLLYGPNDLDGTQLQMILRSKILFWQPLTDWVMEIHICTKE